MDPFSRIWIQLSHKTPLPVPGHLAFGDKSKVVALVGGNEVSEVAEVLPGLLQSMPLSLS